MSEPLRHALSFDIDPASTVRDPIVLRKAMRHIAAEQGRKGLPMPQVPNAVYRLDKEVALTDEARLDTAGEAKAAVWCANCTTNLTL